MWTGHHKLFVQKKKVSEAAKDRKGFWAGWIGYHPHTQTTFAFWRCKILELLSANNANRLLHGMCGRYPILASQLTCRWCLWSIRVQALWNAAPLCSAYLCGFSVHSDVSQHVSQWNVEPSLLWCCWLLLQSFPRVSKQDRTLWQCWGYMYVQKPLRCLYMHFMREPLGCKRSGQHHRNHCCLVGKLH